MIKLTVLILASFISFAFANDNPPYAFSQAGQAYAVANGYPPDSSYNNYNRCMQPIDAGPCYQYSSLPADKEDRKKLQRYAYDNTNAHRCVGFYYGGCGGNSNRFNTIEDCIKTCENNQQ